MEVRQPAGGEGWKTAAFGESRRVRAVRGAGGGGAHRSDAGGFASARASLRVDGIGIDSVVRGAGVRETRGRRGASRAVTSRTPEMQQS